MKKHIVLLMILILAISFKTILLEASTDVEVTITSVFDDDNQSTISVFAPLGSEVVLNPEVPSQYHFIFWVVNGVVQKDYLLDHSFVIQSKMELQAVFSTDLNKAVLFVDSNGSLLSSGFISQDETQVVDPYETYLIKPTKPGLKVKEVGRWLSHNGSTLDNIIDHTVFTLQYEVGDISSIDLTIVNGTLLSNLTKTYNQITTVTANEPMLGEVFSHWLKDGIIVSYQETYQFSLLTETTLEAVYSSTTPESKNLITLSGNLNVRENHQTIISQFELLEGFKLVELGLLLDEQTSLPPNLYTTNIKRYVVQNYQRETQEFVVSFNAEYQALNSYMIIKDEFGNLQTVYSNPILNPYEINFYNEDMTLLETLYLPHGAYPQPTVRPTKSATTAYQYQFNGWTLSPAVNHKDYVATFTQVPIEYALYYQLDGGVNSLLNPTTHHVESNIDLAHPTKDGYNFLGWYLDSNYLTKIEVVTGYVNDLTLFAKWEVDYMDSFKILSIGNSFSEDAHRYLFDIAKSYGIPEDKILIVNMFRGGESLAGHVINLNANTSNYQFQIYTSSTIERDSVDRSLNYALSYAKWDVITFQQVSSLSGDATSFGDSLNSLVNWAKTNSLNPNVKIGYHMSWAYQRNSNHWDFWRYDFSQMTMYESIVNATLDNVDFNNQFDYFIPSGTAIQNVRTSYIGDNLTRDGYHLTLELGRYIASLTFFKSITGLEVSPSTILYRPENVSLRDQTMAMEAVNNAYVNPISVTESTDKQTIITPHQDVDLYFESGYYLSENGVPTLGNFNNYSEFANKFGYSNIVSADYFEGHTTLNVAEGYKIRLIYFDYLGDGTYKLGLRTDPLEGIIELNNKLFRDYNYFGFNIFKATEEPIHQVVSDMKNKLQFDTAVAKINHVDTELTFTPGFWLDGGFGAPITEADPNNQTAYGNIYGASNIYSKAYFDSLNAIVVQPNYQIRLIKLNYDNYGTYTVVGRTDFLTGLISLETITDFRNYQYIAITIGTTPTSYIRDKMHTLPEKVSFRTLAFEQGYWNGIGAIKPIKAADLLDVSHFDNRFGASNIFTQAYFNKYSSITVASGYTLRVIFMNYDSNGHMALVERSENITGTVNISSINKGNYTFRGSPYIAFNISKGTAYLGNEINTVHEKVTFS